MKERNERKKLKEKTRSEVYLPRPWQPPSFCLRQSLPGLPPRELLSVFRAAVGGWGGRKDKVKGILCWWLLIIVIIIIIISIIIGENDYPMLVCIDTLAIIV